MSLNVESSYICIILHCSDFSHLAPVPTHYPSVVPLPSLSPHFCFPVTYIHCSLYLAPLDLLLTHDPLCSSVTCKHTPTQRTHAHTYNIKSQLFLSLF